MNKKLLIRIMKSIERYPLNTRIVGGWLLYNDRLVPEGDKTAVCIAGWALANGYIDEVSKLRFSLNFPFEERAAAKLELKAYDARRLFYVTEWPQQFQDAFGPFTIGKPSTREERFRQATATVGRIQHFIDTKGKE